MRHARKVAARKAQETKRRNAAARQVAQQQQQQPDEPRTNLHTADTSVDPEPALDNIEEDRQCIAKQLYTPIEDWQTRIIRIRSGSEEEVLRLDIIVAAITEAPGVGLISESGQVHYEALSYAWGDNNFTHSVVCNGTPFTVTANLHEALVHLRQNNSHRFLWVDALCINQYDLEEKARQILKLHKTFKRARQVVVWLGQEALHTQLAITWMCSFRLQQIARSYSDVGADQLATLCDLHAVLDGLTDLLKRPWVKRIWILQEVYSAKSVAVQCGSSEIAWKFFEMLPSCRRWVQERLGSTMPISKDLEVMGQTMHDVGAIETDHDLIEAQRCMDVLVALANPSRNSTNDSGMFNDLRWDSGLKNLAGLLRQTYMFQATDRRDKVYALLGIAGVSGISPGIRTTDESSHLVIDYHPSVTEEKLCRRLLKLFASEIQDLTFLDHWTCATSSNTRPTWQPIEFPYDYVFKQIGNVVKSWGNEKGTSLKPDYSPYSLKAGEAFRSKDRLKLSGRKLETISTLSSVELPTADNTTDCVELCFIGKTERISSLADIDKILSQIGRSEGMCEQLRQILRGSWWSWDLPVAARPGDTLFYCKGVRKPKVLRKGSNEHYTFVGSAKISARHYSLGVKMQQKIDQGVQDFCLKWLAGYGGDLHDIMIE
ncbi:hypothetical protein Q7P36_011179 [Cladosporium allicinum]